MKRKAKKKNEAANGINLGHTPLDKMIQFKRNCGHDIHGNICECESMSNLANFEYDVRDKTKNNFKWNQIYGIFAHTVLRDTESNLVQVELSRGIHLLITYYVHVIKRLFSLYFVPNV